MIRFEVDATPIAQPRPRAVVRGKRAVIVSAFADHPVTDFKRRVRWAAKRAWPGDPLSTACYVSLVFVLPRPQSMTWKTKPTPRVWHVGRPDVDNLAKSVLDACNGICWVDDSQIARMDITKVIASGGEQPHVEVTISGHIFWEE